LHGVVNGMIEESGIVAGSEFVGELCYRDLILKVEVRYLIEGVLSIKEIEPLSPVFPIGG
jgi:hypothetical protein